MKSLQSIFPKHYICCKDATKFLKPVSYPQAVFLYFIINVLWVVATFFLQLIGNDIISIKIPKFSEEKNITEYLKVGTSENRVQHDDKAKGR